MNDTYDVIIAGAGPAGLLSAYLLAQEGWRVHVIERKPTIERKVCGEYLCPKGVQLLRELGLASTLLANFHDIKGMKIVTPDQNVVSGHFPKRHNCDVGASVNREIFDRRLGQLAQEAGATISFGEQLLSIESTAYGYRLQTKSCLLQTRLLIGADGRHSTVARLANLSLPSPDKKVAIHVHAKGTCAFSSQHAERLGEMHLFEGGPYIGIDPINQDEVNVSLVCPAEQLKIARVDQLLLHYLAKSDALKDYQHYIRPEEVRSVFPITHAVSSATARHLALIGDAAGFIDPLTGEGMYNALWMAKTLCHNLIHERQSLFDVARPLALYQCAKDRHFRQKTILNTAFQWVIKRRWVVHTLARFLGKNSQRSNVFMGIIGNNLTPLQGLRKLMAS